MVSAEHRVTVDDVRSYLGQPMKEMVAIVTGIHGRKDFYAVFNVLTKELHYTVNGVRIDSLEDAVKAYNEAAPR